MPNWVIEGLLATSPRPGYRPGPEFRVPRDDVASWASETYAFGVRSIMVLISDDQLPLYHPALPEGLLGFYQEFGFEVAHIPTFDGMTVPYTPEQYAAAWEAFQQLPKPVLVHCSAGMDRTGRIVRHIVTMLDERGGAEAAGG
jgi:hypothetical protein